MALKIVEAEMLNGKIESFIGAMLKRSRYEVFIQESVRLLTHNRFDLGFKLAYLNYKDILPELAFEIYNHDIRSQTLGKFEEYGNKEKASFKHYLDHFEETFNNIKINGFDSRQTIIPLSAKGSILNGSHRVASAIFLHQPVTCVKTELDEVSPDYRYFIERNVPVNILDIGAISFSDYAENVFLAFLWPSGRRNYDQTELLFPNVIYKKEIKLNSNGGLQLLIELYKHMEWLGTAERNFPGAHRKLIECFTDFDAFTVVLFQCEALEMVKEIKSKIRAINKIGFSSVHITDTKEEVSRIARLVFSENGLHFLNYALPYKFGSTAQMIEGIRSIRGTQLQHIAVDGSMTLSVYGLREARDIDFIASKPISLPKIGFEFESHDSQLAYHAVGKNELIFNPKYMFSYHGVKFVALTQIYKFKKNRDDLKDRIDCQMIKSLIDKNSLSLFIAKFKHEMFYRKLILKSRFRDIVFIILKATGTYGPVRDIYRKIKNE